MRLSAALALAVGLLAGCHHRLPRLHAQGRHAEVVERAQGSRFRPRKKAARAYAASLHALGRDLQALDALLLDYRRGGNLASLIALADLERTIGWRGLAAHHYTRALTHDRDALSGRTEVCALFRERAAAYLHADEGVAADADMRRVALICPHDAALDASLAARADAAAQAHVQARVASGQCPPPCTPGRASRASRDSRDLAGGLEAARRTSPEAVASHAAEVGRELPAEVIVELLEAEARGDLGLSLLSDDAVRGWVGGQSWSDLAATVMSASGPVAAYVQLRLSSVVVDIPLAPGAASARELDRWAEQAQRIPDAQAWRVHAATGDVATAELSLATHWRPPRTEPAEPAEPAEPGEPAEPDARVEHWSQRLPITAQTLVPALAAARLRKASGNHDASLRLMTRALREAAAAGLPEVDALGRDAVVAAIGWGRPWHALALLDTGAVAEPAALRGAASTSIVFARAMCDGSCRDDADLGVVSRVMGDDWVDATREGLLDWSLARRTRAPRTGGCPTVAELLEPDTPGPLADALRMAREGLSGPGVGDALAAALASDVRGWCAGAIVLPAMLAGEHTVPARRLADGLSHVPEMQASADLVTHAKLAMVAGQSDRAAQLAVAAGGESADPRRVWLEIADFAALASMREVELSALREALLVTPGLEDRSLALRMLLIALGDVSVSWGQDGVAGKEATARHVTTFLDPLARERRWQAQRALLGAVEDSGLAADLDDQRRALLIEALGGAAALSLSHPRVLLRLQGRDPGPARGPLDGEGLVDDIRAGRASQVPEPLVALTDPRAFEAPRLAWAESARDWSVRRRMAVSLLAMGSAQSRLRAWAVLVEMANASKTAQQDALRSLIVARPAALRPTVERWGAVSPTVVLEGEDALVRVVLGLDLEGPVVAP